MHHGAHHDLTRHREASRVHLAEDDRFTFARLHFNVVASSLLRLLKLKLVKLGVVDVLPVLRLHFVVDDVNIAIALLGHGKVLRNSGSSLLCKVCSLALSKLLLSAASHELPDQIVLVVLTLLIAKEDRTRLSVAADTELCVLHIVRPVELDEHVVLTRLKVFILLPDVPVHAHLSILVNKALLLGVWVLNLSDNQAHIGVVVVDVTAKAPIVSLID